MTPKTIITGCDIVVRAAPDSATIAFTQHGDLWLLGDTYIFNACGEPSYEGQRTSDKALIVKAAHHENYFERRNVYVVNRADAYLDEKAAAYVAGAPR